MFLRPVLTHLERSGIGRTARIVQGNLIAHARAAFALHACERVGRRARAFGKVYLESIGGTVRIGDDFVIGGAASAVHLAVARDGIVGIGDDVTIEYGSSISARSLVSLGHGVRIGPHCVISDAAIPLPLPLPKRHRAHEAVRAIMVGDDVWLGARVTLMPGIRIGNRAVVAPGSVVTTDLPDDALAAGNPARPISAGGALLYQSQASNDDDADHFDYESESDRHAVAYSQEERQRARVLSGIV